MIDKIQVAANKIKLNPIRLFANLFIVCLRAIQGRES